MIVNWEGKAYSLDFAELTMHQAEVIEKESGLSLEEWLDELGAGTKRLQFVKLAFWLMLAQNGGEVPVAAVDFPLLKFSRAFAAALAAEPAAEPPPVPTIPGQGSPTSPSPQVPPSPAPREVAAAPVTVS